jgi:hypothetical protein
VGIGITLVIVLAAGIGIAGGSGAFTTDQTAVTSWKAGSADIAGKVTNKTGSGCSHLVIHIEELDHNSAIVDKLDIPVGDVGSNQTVAWSNHLTNLGGIVENPVPANVSAMRVTSVTCEDVKG